MTNLKRGAVVVDTTDDGLERMTIVGMDDKTATCVWRDRNGKMRYTEHHLSDLTPVVVVVNKEADNDS